jgi:hypothetical protein
MDPRGAGSHSQSQVPAHKHAPHPADLSYRVVVRTALWVIAGATFLGLAIWWFLT